MVKKEMSQKAKLSIYLLINVPTLTYDLKLWVTTKRTRYRIQVAEMTSLRRVDGLTLRGRVRREELRVQPLLLHIDRGKLRWLEHLFRMRPGHTHTLPREVFRAYPAGRRPRGRPRAHWRDYVSRLAWECLWVPPRRTGGGVW